jgi:hypothetical protein
MTTLVEAWHDLYKSHDRISFCTYCRLKDPAVVAEGMYALMEHIDELYEIIDWHQKSTGTK